MRSFPVEVHSCFVVSYSDYCVPIIDWRRVVLLGGLKQRGFTAFDCRRLGLFQKLSSGAGGPQALFCLVGGGCFVDDVCEGWGISLTNPVRGVGINLSCGSRRI